MLSTRTTRIYTIYTYDCCTVGLNFASTEWHKKVNSRILLMIYLPLNDVKNSLNRTRRPHRLVWVSSCHLPYSKESCFKPNGRIPPEYQRHCSSPKESCFQPKLECLGITFNIRKRGYNSVHVITNINFEYHLVSLFYFMRSSIVISSSWNGHIDQAEKISSMLLISGSVPQ